MTREDIIRIADEAGFFVQTAEQLREKTADVFFGLSGDPVYNELERFAALVIAHREAQSIHSCGPDCQKPLCVNRRREIEAAVEAEREACAEICDAEATIEGIAQRCAANIRARGSK